MNSVRLIQNPQISIQQNQSRFLKSHDKIGKIYSNVNKMQMQQSFELPSFQCRQSREHNDQRSEPQNESQLIFNSSLYFTSINKAHQTPVDQKSFAQSSLVTNNSFRISKIYSSERSKFVKGNKTPQTIGKLSASKLNVEFLQFQQKIKNSKQNKSRSPGYFTGRKSSNFNQKEHEQTNELSKQSDINKSTREQFLINLIEKQHKEIKKFVSQLPVPQKNINKIKYSYPVSRSRINHPKNHYNDERSILSKRLSVSSQFSSQKQSTKRQNTQVNPKAKVTFNVRTPRKMIGQDNQEVFEKKKQQNQLQSGEINEWKHKISRVSLYNPELNLNYNNRKPKHVHALIDPFEQYFSFSPQQQSIDLSIISKHFSRTKHQSSTPQLSQNQQHFITLKTTVTEIKSLLIQSRQTINLHILLPSVLFQNKMFCPQIEIKDLHMFLQKVYTEMKVKPEIVTLKRYDNAIFTGVMSKSDERFNFFKSVIYHFRHGVYIGGWKQNKTQQRQGKIDGCKEGMGVEILYKHLENENTTQPSTNDTLQTTIYIGQFLNNEKHGYGIRFITTFNITKENNDNTSINQTIEIGCWSRNQKHGWIKTYKNNKLQQSAEYENNAKVTERK